MKLKISLFATISISFFIFQSSFASVQNSECLPSDAGKNWPVMGVYLHGLFTSSGADTNGFRILEQKNREQLAAYARENHIRIAVPVSKNISRRGNWRQWNGVALKDIEAAAEKACSAKLSEKRFLIGFSNGANRVAEIGQMNCNVTAAYSKILVIGQTGTSQRGKCPNQVVNKKPHAFPPAAFFTEHLEEIIYKGTTAKKSSAGTSDNSGVK